MARHEFGIMEKAPSAADNFEAYEPERYSCICIDDIYIEGILSEFDGIRTYFHRLSQESSGLNYIGITLIPPGSCGSFREILKRKSNSVYDGLCGLFELAEMQEKFVIHYGL